MERLPIELWYHIARYVPALLQVSRSIAAYERRRLENRIKLVAAEYVRNPFVLLHRIIGENDVGMWRYYWPIWSSKNSHARSLVSVAIAASRHCNYKALSAIWSTCLRSESIKTELSWLYTGRKGPWVSDPLLLFAPAVVMAHLVVVNQTEQSNRRCKLIIASVNQEELLVHAIMMAILYGRIEYGYRLYINYGESKGICCHYILAALYAVEPTELVLQWRDYITVSTSDPVNLPLVLAKCWRGDMLTDVERRSVHLLGDDVFRPQFLLNPAMPPVMIESWPFKYSAERDKLILSSLSPMQKVCIKLRKETDLFSYQYYERKFREHGIDL